MPPNSAILRPCVVGGGGAPCIVDDGNPFERNGCGAFHSSRAGGTFLSASGGAFHGRSMGDPPVSPDSPQSLTVTTASPFGGGRGGGLGTGMSPGSVDGGGTAVLLVGFAGGDAGGLPCSDAGGALNGLGGSQ